MNISISGVLVQYIVATYSYCFLSSTYSFFCPVLSPHLPIPTLSIPSPILPPRLNNLNFSPQKKKYFEGSVGKTSFHWFELDFN